MSDPFDLQRFMDAQDRVYETALAELTVGHKRSHWMWFIFPQIAGLGSSAMAQRYAIASLAEAMAYLAHPILGPRLRECTAAAMALADRTAHQVFGSPDDLKFRSCMTLFTEAAPQEPLFRAGLGKFFGGDPDPRTLEILRR